MKRQKLAPVIALLSVFTLRQEISSQEILLPGTLQDMSVNSMTPSSYYVGSKIKDENALGGFYRSDNLPRAVTSDMYVEQDKVQLLALPEEGATFAGKYKGMKLLLINKTGGQVTFPASDSRLYIVQEALDQNGDWKPIESPPWSSCGNSRHRVSLGADEFWEIAAARYTGEYATKLRFKLAHGDLVIYSNEFDGSVNSGQFAAPLMNKLTRTVNP